jgi:hypothetical protein
MAIRTLEGAVVGGDMLETGKGSPEKTNGSA